MKGQAHKRAFAGREQTRHTSVPSTDRDCPRWLPWDQAELPCGASESAAGQGHFTVFPASESHLLTSCAIISSDLSIWTADPGECRQPGSRQGSELGAAGMVNIPSQRLPTGGSASESNGFCSFCFCSFHKGFCLTHDFPTSSFCSLR